VIRIHRSHALLLGGALASTLLVAACTGAPQAAPTPATAAAKPTPPAAPVAADTARRGSIQQSLSYSGDIRAREQVTVLPKGTGRVERLMVDVGSQVKAGDTLAVLEQDNAEIQALQARAALAGAEAKLATLQAGPRAEDVAAAESALAQQLVRLQNMRTGGRAEDVRTAQEGLAAAQARLAALHNGADEGVRQAQQSAVDSDKAAVASAEAAFAALGANNAASMQQAQSQVDTLTAQLNAAQAQINSADAALANLSGSSAADVQAAQSAYDAAVAGLRSAQAAQAERRNPTQPSIAQAEAALEAAKAQRAQAAASHTALEEGVGQPCVDSTNPLSGAVTKHNGAACESARESARAALDAADAGVEAAKGQLDLLKRGGSPATQTEIQGAVDQAQAQVKTAQTRLEALKNGGLAAARAQLEAQRQQAQGQLVQVQENLKVANANLSAAKSGNLDAQVKSAQANLTAARERLKSDEARLEVILRGPTAEDVQQAEAAVNQAQQQLLKARQPYTSYDLQAQEHAVAQAQAMLDKARNPFTEPDLAAAQAGVDQARAQLELAQLGVRETRVLAPVDGVIAERLVAPGASVSPQTALVTLVPPALELMVNVEESQLGQVAVGQSVQLEVPAFPRQMFSGTVKSIAPTVDSKTRTAAVRIEPRDDGSKLRSGMFARLSIITASRDNTLVVPRQAVLSTAAGTLPSVITIDSEGRVRKQPIRLGIQNDQLVEVVGGLDDGQLVATSNLNDLVDGDVVAPQVENRTALAR